MESIDLSIIVACYNVDDFLETCLNSIRATQFPHERMEVIMVDDGSSDRTGQIIDQYDQKYAFFHAYHKVNGGISTTRNFGIDHAKGQYIAFVDGDDVVPSNAYTNLMYNAEINHADVVAGFVNRFDSLRHDVPSYLHSFAIKDDRTYLTLQNAPELLYDTTVWNKVYNRAFLNEHKIRFMEGIIYEDLPFTLEVHLASQNTSTIKDVVYQWRWRETSDSITQSRSAIRNYQHRLNALNFCSQLLINAGYDVQSNVYQTLEHKVLTLDLAIFLDEIGNAEETYIYKVQELTYLFLRDWNLWDSELIKEVPLKQQIQFYAIKTGDFQLLKKYTYVKNVGLFKRYPLTHHYKFYFPTMKHAEVLNYLSFAKNMFPHDQELNRLNIDLDRHLIHGNGMFRIKRLPLAKKLSSAQNYRETLSARLINIENNRSVKIQFQRKVTPAYKRMLKPKGLWTNARYEFSFNYLTALQKLGRGIWKIKMNDTVDQRFIAQDYMGNFNRHLNAKLKHFNTEQNQITTEFNTKGELTFKVHSLALLGAKNVNWIANPSLHGRKLVFEANVIDYQNVQPVLHSHGHRLNGHFDEDLKQIIFDCSTTEFTKRLDATWHLSLIHFPTNKDIEYLYDHSDQRKSMPIDDNQQLELIYRPDGGIDVTEHLVPIYIDHFTLKNNVLYFKGHLGFDPHHFALDLKHFKIEMINRSKVRRYLLTPQTHQMVIDGQQFSFQLPLTNDTKNQLSILAGSYYLTAFLKLNGDVRQLPLMMDNKLSMKKQLLPFADDDKITYRVFSDRQSRMHVAIQQPFYGWFNQKRSRRALSYSLWYPLMRLLPLRRVVVFDSYWSTQFSSNERAIYEYLQQHDPKLKTVWFFSNRQIPITYHGERVKKGSFKYWYYLAVAKYLFQNTNFPDEYLKRRNQIEVETLHGTFLKRMGFDEPHFRNATRKLQNRFADRIRRWDYLVVPSDYMAKTATSAFDYHQKLIRSGFPRNDALYQHNHPQYIEKIKTKLNIPLNKKVILYAPTYRNDGGFDFKLDLKSMQEQLSDQYVLLVRLHYFVAHSNHFYNYPGFVYDVSDYDDINDLYLISDVLITDYSSVMFDYAHLKRPMIFFAYDKNWYLDNHNRGVYLDYDREMPGPIVKTNRDLIEQLKHLRQLKQRYAHAIQHFHDQFAEYGSQGLATKQVVATVLNTNNHKLNQAVPQAVIFNKFWHLFKIKNFQSKLLKFLGNHLPRRKIIIFDSFFGTQASDNPKAIYDYLKKHHPEYRLYWDANPDDIHVFKRQHLPYIKRFGYRGILKQAQAKYFITNVRRPFRWKVPKNAQVLQTWHGTPLKKIGTDVSLVTMPGNNAIKYHHEIYRDAKRWSYLIAPNQYSNQIMRRAFQMDANEMMLTGYPRNDILVNANDAKIAEIKRRLHIDSNRKVILYAPTWRDDEYVKNDEFTARLHLDLAKIKAHFGHQVLILIRTHYLIANQLNLNENDVAIDVSRYPDIAELYLISDVLITDYSSVMFDYSILRRPMIFFAYDFEQYANQIRGFYFDFTKEAPGPIVKNNDEVIQALDDIFAGWQLDDRYQEFIDKYDHWMDGKSSQRVVEQLLNDDNVYEDTSFDFHQWQLTDQVKIRDGAILWSVDKNFTYSNSNGFIKNYNAKDEWFEVIKRMQLKSRSFNQSLGMKFVLIQKNDWRVWVSLDDIHESK